MDVHQLEIYIAAAQYLNFTKASKQLNMVPSAVSHSISMLENELETKLFTRNNNKLSLTVDGQEFLKDAIRIVTIANNARNRHKIKRIDRIEKLNIGLVFPEFIYKYMPVLRAFYEKNPMVEICSMQYDSITLARMLSDKKLDVAFGRRDMFSTNPYVVWKSLYKDPFRVVMHRDHILASKESITIPMLTQERILVMNREVNPGMFDMIQHLFLSHDMAPNIHDQSNHHLTTLMLAALKMGIVIIPNQNICHIKLPEELVCKELCDSRAYHEIGIAWNVKNISQRVEDFLLEFGIAV